MTVIRNVLVGVAWFVFIAGAYIGWVALTVLVGLDKRGLYSTNDIGYWIGEATFPSAFIIPLVAVVLGYRFSFLPGFKKRTQPLPQVPKPQVLPTSEADKRTDWP